jgi:hypothetical protein
MGISWKNLKSLNILAVSYWHPKMGGPACMTKTNKFSYAANVTNGLSNETTDISTPETAKTLRFYKSVATATNSAPPHR